MKNEIIAPIVTVSALMLLLFSLSDVEAASEPDADFISTDCGTLKPGEWVVYD